MRISQLTKAGHAENRRKTAPQNLNSADNLYFVWNPRACDTLVIGGPSNGATILLGPDYSGSPSPAERGLKVSLQAQCLVL